MPSPDLSKYGFVPVSSAAPPSTAPSHLPAPGDLSAYGMVPMQYTGSEQHSGGPLPVDETGLQTPEGLAATATARKEDLESTLMRLRQGGEPLPGNEMAQLIGSAAMSAIPGPTQPVAAATAAAKISAALARYGPIIAKYPKLAALGRTVGMVGKATPGIAWRSGMSGVGAVAGEEAYQLMDNSLDIPYDKKTMSDWWAEHWKIFKQNAAYPAAIELGVTSAAAGWGTAVDIGARSNLAKESRAYKAFELERLQKEKAAVAYAKEINKMDQAEYMAQMENDSRQIADKIGPSIHGERQKAESRFMHDKLADEILTNQDVKWKKMDENLVATLRDDAVGKVDTNVMIDLVRDYMAKQPRGKGFWSAFVNMPEDARRVYGAMMRAVNAEELAALKLKDAVLWEQVMAAMGKPRVAMNVDTATGKYAMAGNADVVGNLEELIGGLADAGKAHGAVPLGVLVQARGQIARTIMSPNTSRELKGILTDLLEKPSPGAKGILDRTILTGLTDFNPALVPQYLDALQYTHQSSVLRDKVLFRLMGKTSNNVEPLSQYIGDATPQAASDVRILLNKIGKAEELWPAVQRSVIEKRILDSSGNIKIGNIDYNLTKMGDETLSQLSRLPNGKPDLAFIASVDSLRDLSRRYNNAISSTKADQFSKMQRIRALELAISDADIAVKDANTITSRALSNVTTQHVAAGILVGRVFGWLPAIVGGTASSVVREAGSHIAKMAHDPALLNAFNKNLEEWIVGGSKTRLVNLVRLWKAAKPTYQVAEPMFSDIFQQLAPSHDTQSPYQP